jgi:hypothetical protein
MCNRAKRAYSREYDVSRPSRLTIIGSNNVVLLLCK